MEKHQTDKQCICLDRSNVCIDCGAHHGDECPDCGARAYHEGFCPTMKPANPHIGEFISIPAWNTFGMVVKLSYARMGSDDAFEVLLNEDPEQRGDSYRTFRLEPGQFTIEV